MIPFNKPYMTGKETSYIEQAVESGKISGNGTFTKKCHAFFEKSLNAHKALLTTSCTDALEMCAILIDIKRGDEVIMPSYTFVSTANAFVLRGAKIAFADSCLDNPNIDVDRIEELITPKTKAIVVVHYGGVAVDMDAVMKLASKYKLYVIEDAAQAIDSYYKGKPLGSFGHMAAFSFHETKNIIAGEGGLLVINDEQFVSRSEIIWEKGTNRSAFFRGEVDKYNWVDLGSSFLPSEVTAAFLYAQIENIETIQSKRKALWKYYYNALKPMEEKGILQLPVVPEYATNNGHLFYIVCKSLHQRIQLIKHLKSMKILAVFHYQSLHQSPFYREHHDGRQLTNSDKYTHTLVRLPLYFELSQSQQETIVKSIKQFYEE